jgi:CotH kinase protein/Bacterial Ig-like domain (group 3)
VRRREKAGYYVRSKCRLAAGLICRLVLVLTAASCGGGDDLSLTLGTGVLTIHPGDQGVPVNFRLAPSSYKGLVSITATGLPSGISLAPLAVAPGSAGVLSFSATASADQEGFPTNYIVADAEAVSKIRIIATGGGHSSGTSLALTVSLSNSSFSPSTIDLPIVSIDTGGTPIADKTTDVPGTITITSADGTTTYLPNSSNTDNSAVFHLHGNTTASMPKKPYHIKLTTGADLLHTMGLDCPYVTGAGKSICDKSKSYDLLANYDDKSLLRDWAASALANAIPIGQGYLNYATPSAPSPSGTSTPMSWAPHSLFVELYVNGEYEGNYQLIEEIKVDTHRININELAETDINDDISGGYLLEIDANKGETYNFNTTVGVAIGVVDPDFSPDPNVPEQMAYITDYVDKAEAALYANTLVDPVIGWRAYFDEAAAVNYYIVMDLMGNVDGGAFYSSDYLYKARDNPYLYMGPVWDFDIAAGNVNYQPIVNPTVPWMQTEATWYRRWFQDPTFAADVATQWNALKNNGVLAGWLASVQQQAATLQLSQANNFARWPMLGIEVWPNTEAVGSYDGEVSYLTQWLQLRMGYLDSRFNSKTATVTSLTAPATLSLSASPSTVSVQVTGGTHPTGNVFLLSDNIVVGSSPINAAGAATVSVAAVPGGAHTLVAVYAGDNTNALSSSAGASATINP